MSADLVSDDLWNVWLRCCRLVLRVGTVTRGGCLPMTGAALCGIVYVLRKSVSWRDVPAELVGCSGVTAWRRLRDWTEAGVWPRLHEVLLAELRRDGLLEMDDAAIDASHVRALKGGLAPDLRRLTERGRAASTT
ncbi:Transposase OS=Streptomyces microflavus OX=1919 GN=Smic_85610 PE=4 SV=1 [Streptomyces microflavus]